MPKNRLRLSIILLLGLTGLHAQTMYVNQSNGKQNPYSLNTVRKITFSTGNLIVTNTNNIGEQYPLNGLSHLSFTYSIPFSTQLSAVKSQKVIFYPNPAGDVLYIDLSEQNEFRGVFSILTLEGRVVYMREITGKGIVTIDISDLPVGIFLCHFVSPVEIYTMRIVKH